MEGGKKFIIVVAVSLVLGLLIGSGMRGGEKEKKLELKEILELATAEYSNLVRENEELKALAKKAGAGEKENKTLAAEINSLKQELRKTGDENRRLEQAVAAFETASSERQAQEAALITSVDDARNRIAALEQENQKLREDNAAARDRIAGLQARLSETEITASAADQTEEAKQQEPAADSTRMSSLEAENQSLKEQIEKVRKEVAASQETMALMQEQLSATEARAVQAEKAMAEQQKEWEADKGESAEEYRERVTVLEEENKTLKARIDKVLKDNEEAAKNLDQLRAEMAKVEKKAQTGEELLILSTDLKNRVVELENENRDLKELVEKISRMLDVQEEGGGNQAP